MQTNQPSNFSFLLISADNQLNSTFFICGGGASFYLLSCLHYSAFSFPFISLYFNFFLSDCDECVNTLSKLIFSTFPLATPFPQSPPTSDTQHNPHHTRHTHMDAKTLLLRDGWSGPGTPLNPNRRPGGPHGGLGLTKPLLVARRSGNEGVGKKTTKDPTNQWWLRGFEDALKGVDNGAGGAAGGSSRAPNALTSELYRFFVRGEGLAGTIGGSSGGQDKKEESKSKRKRDDEEDKKGEDSKGSRTEEKHKKRKMKTAKEGDASQLVSSKERKESKEERRQRKKEKKERKEAKEAKKAKKAAIGSNDETPSSSSSRERKEKKKEKKAKKETNPEDDYPTPTSTEHESSGQDEVKQSSKEKKREKEDRKEKKELKESRKSKKDSTISSDDNPKHKSKKEKKEKKSVKEKTVCNHRHA